MPRILPERTVEAWTTAYITRWDPTAVLWAPTQNDPRKWDISARSSTGAHFVFEYKGVEGSPEPYVPINRDQLRAYALLNRRVGATFVWYLLPAWTFQVSRGQILPAEAELRVIRAADPRPEWRGGNHLPNPDTAAALPSFREEMALTRGCEAYFYVADPERLLRDRRLRTFPGWYGPTGFPIGLVRELAEGLTLEHFVSLLHRGRLGISGDALALGRNDFDEDADQPRLERLPLHHATAFAVQTRAAE